MANTLVDYVSRAEKLEQAILLQDTLQLLELEAVADDARKLADDYNPSVGPGTSEATRMRLRRGYYMEE